MNLFFMSAATFKLISFLFRELGLPNPQKYDKII